MTTDAFALACALVDEHNPAHLTSTVYPREGYALIDLRCDDLDETHALTFVVDTSTPPGSICERVRCAFERFEARLDCLSVERRAVTP